LLFSMSRRPGGRFGLHSRPAFTPFTIFPLRKAANRVRLTLPPARSICAWARRTPPTCVRRCAPRRATTCSNQAITPPPFARKAQGPTISIIGPPPQHRPRPFPRPHERDRRLDLRAAGPAWAIAASLIGARRTALTVRDVGRAGEGSRPGRRYRVQLSGCWAETGRNPEAHSRPRGSESRSACSRVMSAYLIAAPATRDGPSVPQKARDQEPKITFGSRTAFSQEDDRERQRAADNDHHILFCQMNDWCWRRRCGPERLGP